MTAASTGRAARRRPVGLTVFAVVALLAAALPPVAAAADPSLGYDADYSVLDPNGDPRTDGAISVGDDLSVSYTAVDGTSITACRIRLLSVGGEMMESDGAVDAGACSLTIRLPDFPDPTVRTQYPPDSEGLDLCVWPAALTFADGEQRALAADDHWQPGGRHCSNGYGGEESLDFRVEPGGTPRPFVSDPPVLSWNPADWGTGMVPLTFGETWHFELPNWVDRCQTHLNGGWGTVIRPAQGADCQTWDVRIPGVLPSTMPWEGDPGDWTTSIVTDYTAADGTMGWTFSAQRVPLASSDGVFESSLRSIFPTDLATAQFVTTGERWQPVFQLGGGDATACEMTMTTVPPTFPADPVIFTQYPGVVDAEERCAFDLDPMAEWESHQYWVKATYAGGIDDPNLMFGADILAIPVPAPPVIEPPVTEPDGDTEIGVEPGEGQGLVLDVEVEPAEDATGPQPLGAVSVCEDRSVSTNLAAGGSIPHLIASCDLPAGNYVAIATMVDAAGTVSTSERLFSVRPRPLIVGRTPLSGATGVRRDAQPAIRFNMPVKGVSSHSFLLRDLTTGGLVPAGVAYNTSTWRATLTPTALLVAGRTYRLEVTGRILNSIGRSLIPTSWTFKVSTDGTAPTYTRSPAAGATGVSRSANVAVQFSEKVTGVSGTTLRLKDTATGLFVAATVTYDATLKRATLNPSPTLAALRTYQVVISTGIKDLAGNPLAASSWTFKTRS